MQRLVWAALFALLSISAAYAQPAVPETVTIPAGPAIVGSDANQREYGYQLDEKAYGHSRTRQGGWYNREGKLRTITLPGYAITKNLITNAQYAEFLQDTGHRFPHADKKTWEGYGLIHPFKRAKRHMWASRQAPEGRGGHPVVMVAYKDVEAYIKWLSRKTGIAWRLPSELEWEKAVRGEDGRYFPWGNEFNASLLNSHDNGPFNTVPVGSFPKGASPYGLLDGAGQVFEWTSTRAGNNRHIVKGGSWDDKGCGVCRAAARHSRPNSLKHILVGFRLVRDLP